MRFFSTLTCLTVGSLVGGCSPYEEPVTPSPSPNVINSAADGSGASVPDIQSRVQQTEALVFRGSYYQTTGPCIEIGDGSIGMPYVDAFDVVEVLDGNLRAKSIYVHAMTAGGSSYPKDLTEGELYTLRLTPSVQTSKQLQDLQSNPDLSLLWIAGDEIEEQRATK